MPGQSRAKRTRVRFGVACGGVIWVAAACAVVPSAETGARYPEPVPSNPVPEYPWLHSSVGIGADLVARFTILPDGTVDSTSVVIDEEYPPFSDVTRGAILRWRFAVPPDRERDTPLPYSVVLRFFVDDTIAAVPGEVVTLRRATVLDQDSTSIRIAVGRRVPTAGRPVIGGSKDLRPPELDSMMITAVLEAMTFNGPNYEDISNGALCLGQLPPGVANLARQEFPGARSTPDCPRTDAAQTVVWTGGGGRSNTSTCYFRRVDATWEPLCFHAARSELWVSEDGSPSESSGDGPPDVRSLGSDASPVGVR